MMLDPKFESALASSNPVGELRQLAQSALDGGAELSVVHEQFEQARQQLRTEAREDDENAVTDVLDFLTGWCSPHVRLGAPDSDQP